MHLSDYGIPKSSISTILDSFEVDSKNSKKIRSLFGTTLSKLVFEVHKVALIRNGF